MKASPNRIRCARHLASLTQAGLARRLGVSRSRWSRIERGLVEPTRGEIIQLAWISGLLESWFYRPMPRPTPPCGHESSINWGER